MMVMITAIIFASFPQENRGSFTVGHVCSAVPAVMVHVAQAMAVTVVHVNGWTVRNRNVRTKSCSTLQCQQHR